LVTFNVFVCNPLSITVEVPDPEILNPAEMVEVELVPVTFKNPAMVEVAVVDAVVRKFVVSDSLMVEVAPFAKLVPPNERRVPGVVVPIPRFVPSKARLFAESRVVAPE
jgi:hypothetical protein